MELKKKKRIQRKLSRFLLIISSSLLISCGTTVPDVPLCTEIDIDRGYCVNTISSTEFEVSDESPWNGKTWWDIRPYMIYMPIESWASIKSFIIEICARTKKCKGADVTSWERTINAIDQKIAKP